MTVLEGSMCSDVEVEELPLSISVVNLGLKKNVGECVKMPLHRKDVHPPPTHLLAVAFKVTFK